jgi:proline iminopeptidase
MRTSSILFASSLFALAACGGDKAPSADSAAASATAAADSATASTPVLGPGEAMLAIPGGRIWYKVSGTGTGTPMFLIHGGPGMGSFYMKSMEALADDRPVVRYDQLGTGKSDRMTDTALMKIPRYVEELDSLRRTLKYDKIFLNGNSWGTIVAIEYYKAHPDHVAGIIFSGEAFDIAAAEKEINKAVAQLSPEAQKAFAQYNVDKNLEAPAYKKAVDEFYAKNVWRHPVAADVDSTMSLLGVEQYRYFQGENETMIVGALRGYNAVPDLPNIKVPVLMTTGEFDELGPKLIEQHAKLIPGAKFIVYKDAAHVTQWDAAEQSVKDAREFFRSVDAKK